MTDSCMRLLLVSCDLLGNCLLQEAFAELTEDFRNPTGPRAYEVTTVDLLEDALDLLATPGGTARCGVISPLSSSYDALLLDPQLPDCEGLPCLTRIREVAPDLPVVVIVEKGEHLLGATFVREGAQEFLLKDEIDCGPLARTLRYAVERARLSRRVRESALLDGLTGCHSAMAFRLLAEHDWLVAERLQIPFVLHLIRVRDRTEDRILTLTGTLRRSKPKLDLIARLDDRTFAAIALGPPEEICLGRLADAATTSCDFTLGQSVPLGQLISDAERRLCENEQIGFNVSTPSHQLTT
jgi:CheY-like chemotaxis protein